MTPRRSWFLALTLSAMLPAAIGCSEVREEEAALYRLGAEVTSWHPSVVRAQLVEWRDLEPEEGLEVVVPLFDGDASARIERVAEQRTAGALWSASLPGGALEVAERKQAVAASLRHADTLFQIVPRAEGLVLVERDEALIEGDFAADPEADAGDAGASHGVQPQPDPHADARVDVMVAYTAASAAGAGGVAAIEAVAALAIAETNQGYLDSGVPSELRLVATVATAYDETAFDWVQALSRLRHPADGYMDELHAKRDAVGADCVLLLVDTVGPYAGIGYQLSEPFAPIFDAWAFSVVARDYATGAYTFAHELGHNMGAQHDPDTGGAGFFSDSHGHRDPEAGFRTIMAYPCPGCTRVNLWSNPAVIVSGASAGIGGISNNASTLAYTAPIVAAFRESKTGVVPTVAAEMISPAAGTQILGDAAEFRWSDVGAASYRLQIGDIYGDNRYFDATVSDTEVVALGLPLGGSQLFVRLSTATADGDWLARDYQYQASPEPDYAMSLAFPAPGEQLDTTALAFFWWAAGSEHHLQLGTPQHPMRYLNERLSQSWTWAAVPHHGGSLSARIWTFGADGVGYGEAMLTAPAITPESAEIVEPAPGSQLDGPTVLRWSETTASEHWVVVREPRDGEVLFSASLTAGDEVLLPALSGTGRLLVTVHSLTATGWQDVSATYFLSAGGNSGS